MTQVDWLSVDMNSNQYPHHNKNYNQKGSGIKVRR